MKIVAITIALFLMIQLGLSYKVHHSELNKIYLPPSKSLKFVSFGFNDLFSSLLWLRLVQDIEVCDQGPAKGAIPELDANKDPLADVLERKMPESKCKNGWVFQMLDVISDLTPDFETVYTDGATFLSVLVDDREGAQKIFAKGRMEFPDNWQIYYRSAYHELFEMQNAEAAAELLRQAGEKGAPDWVYALSAKLLTRLGRAEFAKTVLEGVVASGKEGPGMERVRDQLDKINAALGTGK